MDAARLPGSYKVSIGKSGYVTSGITMVRTNADSDAADLEDHAYGQA